jgi:diguanylate cyclase (GGDEF)-like protein
MMQNTTAKGQEKERSFSIKSKMYIFIILTVFIVAFSVAFLAFRMSANKIDEYYKQSSIENARNFATMVDVNYLEKLISFIRTDEFQAVRQQAEDNVDESLIQKILEENGFWEGYNDIRTRLIRYLDKMETIEYLYLIASLQDVPYDIYVIDDDQEPLYETGLLDERGEEFEGVDITQEIPPTISNSEWGWLASSYAPIYNDKGENVCYVGCDISMDEVMAERKALLSYIVLGAIALTALVLAGAVFFIRKVVVDPLDAMTHEMQKFDPKPGATYEDANVINLNIDSHDEINEIYHGIKGMEMRTVDYINNIVTLRDEKEKAVQEIHEKDSRIEQLNIETYKDSLTEVGNKAAYTKKSAELNEECADNRTDFAVVMVDMNNLKQINDEYGHKSGDIYIQGCCKMVCNAFKHSPVYRVGGDEFAVIVLGEDYENRREILQQLQKSFEESSKAKNVEPWQRYSAAVGMAERASDDKTVDFVMKRADKAMYEDKQRYKEEHGSYR